MIETYERWKAGVIGEDTVQDPSGIDQMIETCLPEREHSVKLYELLELILAYGTGRGIQPQELTMSRVTCYHDDDYWDRYFEACQNNEVSYDSE